MALLFTMVMEEITYIMINFYSHLGSWYDNAFTQFIFLMLTHSFYFI